MTENPQICQKCGSPVTPGMKFCESCGAKVEALPACSRCGAPLPPKVKFCESCGAPVTTGVAQAAQAISPAVSPAPGEPEKFTVPEVKAPAEVTAKAVTSPAADVNVPAEPAAVVAAAAATISPVPDTPASPETKPSAKPAKAQKKTAAAPEEKPVPAVKEPVMAEKAKDVPKETGPKKPMSQTTMIIAGVLVLALLGAAAYFVVLPMLSGSGTPVQNPPVLPVPTGTGSASGTAVPTMDATSPGAVSLTTGPTQAPPANRVIILDAERDPISSKVTVTFRGGAGQNGVREIQVTLTRSDGTLETKAFKPDAIGSGVTLQGTAKTDRVEATTYFYTGEQYKILDKIFEYKKRGG